MWKAKKLVHGVGINDADYTVSKEMSYISETGKRVRKSVFRCPYYFRWHNMITRCYSAKYHEKHPTYIGCEVCEEWKTFSNFKEWMSSQKWEGKHLDKDLRVIANKIYSPDTCLFIDEMVNYFVLDSGRSRGQCPIGVSYYKPLKKYRAQCNNPLTRKKGILRSL